MVHDGEERAGEILGAFMAQAVLYYLVLRDRQSSKYFYWFLTWKLRMSVLIFETDVVVVITVLPPLIVMAATIFHIIHSLLLPDPSYMV